MIVYRILGFHGENDTLEHVIDVPADKVTEVYQGANVDSHDDLLGSYPIPWDKVQSFFPNLDGEEFTWFLEPVSVKS